jgi:hypothetical protein
MLRKVTGRAPVLDRLLGSAAGATAGRELKLGKGASYLKNKLTHRGADPQTALDASQSGYPWPARGISRPPNG